MTIVKAKSYHKKLTYIGGYKGFKAGHISLLLEHLADYDTDCIRTFLAIPGGNIARRRIEDTDIPWIINRLTKYNRTTLDGAENAIAQCQHFLAVYGRQGLTSRVIKIPMEVLGYITYYAEPGEILLLLYIAISMPETHGTRWFLIHTGAAAKALGLDVNSIALALDSLTTNKVLKEVYYVGGGADTRCVSYCHVI